jgi:CRP-like cAMP-binding protein
VVTSHRICAAFEVWCAMAANLLISGLPAAEQRRLEPLFERVTLSSGQDLVRPGQSVDFIWFIEGAVVFTAQPVSHRRHIAAGLTGNEGVAGFELWLGRKVSPLSTVAGIGGDALRMSADDLQRHVLEQPSALNKAIGDFVFHFLTMGTQMAVCLATHSPEERLCRWLQMLHLRAPGRERFPFSESQIASLLNMEARTAMLAIRVLEQAGLIQYRDQQVEIVDRDGLRDGCCDCLAIFQERMTRLQGSAQA